MSGMDRRQKKILMEITGIIIALIIGGAIATNADDDDDDFDDCFQSCQVEDD
jgi:hypothetical protein